MSAPKTLFEPAAMLISHPDKSGTPRFEITRGNSILCIGDRIHSIGPRESLSIDAETQSIRLPGKVLVPGTINAHNHSFQSLLRGVADDQPFLVWRDEALYKYAPELGIEGVYTGALLAFAEMVMMGVTTVCDFFYVHGKGIETDLAVRKAARDVGIRLVLARTFYSSKPFQAIPWPQRCRPHIHLMVPPMKFFKQRLTPPSDMIFPGTFI
jgi:cytosine/adenosine deaminase-related metal-dependent hydrolase